MALTIGAAGSSARRRSLLAWHGLGLLVGAILMTSLTTLAGSALRPAGFHDIQVVKYAVSAILILWALRLVTPVGLRYPSSPWQVPKYWRETLSPPLALFLFGTLLASGVASAAGSPLLWVFIGGTLLSASFLGALLAWTIYVAIRFAFTLHETSEVACRADPTVGDATPQSFSTNRATSAALLALGSVLISTGM